MEDVADLKNSTSMWTRLRLLSQDPSILTSGPPSAPLEHNKSSSDWQLYGKDDDYQSSLTTQSEANWQRRLR